MVVKRERMERALEAVRAKLADAVAPGEPGAVVLVSSRGEPAGWVASGVESLESRKSITTHTIFDVGSVAKAVTGSHWSGNLFFGWKSGRRRETGGRR